MSFQDSFHRLFYRERLSRLIESLRARQDCPDMYKPLSLKDVSDILENWLNQAEDYEICHDVFKGMYFCDRPKRHKGEHEDEGLTWR